MAEIVIVGAGLSGATLARTFADASQRVVVVERRGHVGGNCHDELVDGIRVSRHGGHFFHTNSRKVWDFVNRFAEWQQYEHRVKAQVGRAVYSFPPNRMTYQQLGTDDPDTIYRTFFEGYTAKQWGGSPPPLVTKRIPVRDNWDDRYFSDRYQGLPVDGYTAMVERMLDGIPLELNTDYLANRDYWHRRGAVFYTGPVDALCNYELGQLAYRSLEFKTVTLAGDFQGCAAMNYPEMDIPWTRITEWRHTWHTTEPHTVITYEYPREYNGSNEPYYPVRTVSTETLYRQYEQLVRSQGVHLAGRLGSYQYLNMDQAIGQALTLAERLLDGS